ncbi:uncharacterized protein LOC114933424 isoform X2 [Nylanderia fulva]|uniref:uncharacterized protein LOC114933424 isoform X2 n=1 Tax=Nylanderia fulva TaxID=613905 RepID=UPI0010FAF89C|nr:uncharacterized protein LOC114933424 isoform X2 [Nylanderia fulva]
MADKSDRSDYDESSINYKWMWYYMRRDAEYEICNICNMPYTSFHHSNMFRHIGHSHPNTILKKQFTPTQNNGLKCNYCSKIYMASINLSIYTQRHLTNDHKLNENIANELKIWVNQQLNVIKKCDTCDQFKESDIFNIMVHLVEAHRVIVLPKFIPRGILLPKLYNLFHRDRNIADIPTSSSNQLPTCNTLRNYFDNFCSDLNSDRAVESTEEAYYHQDYTIFFIVIGTPQIFQRLAAINNQTCNTLRTYVENFCSDLNPDMAVESTEEANRTNLKRNY